VSKLLLSLIVACGTASPPQSIEDCRVMEPSTERDECYASFLPALFAVDGGAAADELESAVEDHLVRDFVYLEVTRDVDPAGGRWCERISAQAVAERCRVLSRRPHLQRARIGQEPSKGPARDKPPAPKP